VTPATDMARRLAVALREAGTTVVFGVPGGGTNLDVVGAVEAEGMRFVLAHAETPAVIMAGVAAELTGAPSACVVTRGPGAASAVNGAAQALLDRQPLVLVTDCVTEAERRRVSHQRLDQTALLAPASKASLPYGPETSAAEIVALAGAAPAGPVHLDFDPTASASAVPLPAVAAGGDLEAVRRIVRGARRPVVLAGVGAVGAAEDVRRFVEGTGVPVLTTYKAKGVIADSSANAAGLATGATIEAPLLEAADVIVGVGLDPVELIPAPWPYAAPVVLVGSWPIDDSTFFGDRLAAEVTGDIGELLAALGDDLVSDWTGEGQQERRAALDRVRAAVPAAPVGLVPQDVVTIARVVAPPGTVATVDAGAHMLVAMPLWDVEAPGEVLISSGLATMGFSLPAAIAAALVRPDRRVVCFTGDGGIGMALAELETLGRLGLDVTVVVFNDATLSLIAIKQKPDQGDDRAVGYRRTDFAAVAQASGVDACRVDDAESYEKALRASFDRSGPMLVDAAVDPSAYPAVIDVIRGARAPRS
jgi:acetolactate synthase-1/2/3 large subunit